MLALIGAVTVAVLLAVVMLSLPSPVVALIAVLTLTALIAGFGLGRASPSWPESRRSRPLPACLYRHHDRHGNVKRDGASGRGRGSCQSLVSVVMTIAAVLFGVIPL